MAVYAISDLHLSLATDKKMHVFGKEWENYEENIKTNWLQIVKEDDFVLLPGDISWAKSMDEAYSDFAYLHALPGTKLIVKGNHDYWWMTRSKMERFCAEHAFDSIRFVHNNCEIAERFVVCGTRGWMSESTSMQYTDHDRKVFQRELQRLRTSLEAGKQRIEEERQWIKERQRTEEERQQIETGTQRIEAGKQQIGAEQRLVVMLHYPPFDIAKEPSAFVSVLQEYGVKLCVYGHLHGERIKTSVSGCIDGIEYQLISADALQFFPMKIS